MRHIQLWNCELEYKANKYIERCQFKLSRTVSREVVQNAYMYFYRKTEECKQSKMMNWEEI